MNLNDFMQNLDDVLVDLDASKENFRRNMVRESQGGINRPFSEWLHMFLAWNEILYEEDIKHYYWYLDEE